MRPANFKDADGPQNLRDALTFATVAKGAFTGLEFRGINVRTATATGAGTITTAYGLYIDAQTIGGTNYAWYANTTAPTFLLNSGEMTVGSTLAVTGNAAFNATAFPATAHASSINVQLGVNANVFSFPNTSIGVGSPLILGYNTYWRNSTGNPASITTDVSSRLIVGTGGFTFAVAPSVAAGNPQTFTQSMALDTNGRLAVAAISAAQNRPDLDLAAAIADVENQILQQAQSIVSRRQNPSAGMPSAAPNGGLAPQMSTANMTPRDKAMARLNQSGI
jgi:hypothetical protein